MRWLLIILVFSAVMVVSADDETEFSEADQPYPVSNPGHSEQGADCLACHIDIVPEENSHMITSNDDCRFCHELVLTGQAGTDGTTARVSLIITETDDYICVACHVEQDRSEQQANGHLDFGCTTCHSPHGSPYGKMFVRAELDLCAGSCHGDWDLGISHPVGEGIKDAFAGVSMSCVSSCHSMHRPADSGLLQVTGLALCGRCHADKV